MAKTQQKEGRRQKRTQQKTCLNKIFLLLAIRTTSPRVITLFD